MDIHGKVAVVTGAARGIGLAITTLFSNAGATVVAVDREDPNGALATVAGPSGTVVPLELDITDHDAVQREFDDVVQKYGHLDILVNNAGIIARGTFLTLDQETWKRVIDVNVNGTFNCCKSAVSHMVAAGSGRILNISSIAGKMGDITAAPAYGTSKGAINTLTRSLARQLAEFGITVNAIAPHAVETDMSAEWSQEKRQTIIASIPLRRLARPEEIAEAALFLVSDSAAFITGEVLNVNGGALMD